VLEDTKTSSFLLLIVPFLLAIAIPDIAFDFLHRFPNLAATLDEVLKSDALFGLSLLSRIFPSDGRLAFWKQWILFMLVSLPSIFPPQTSLYFLYSKRIMFYMLEINTSLFIYILERETSHLINPFSVTDWILFFTNKKIEHVELQHVFFHKKIFKKLMHAFN